MSIEVVDGVQRYTYEAYPHQKAFHESPKKYRLSGGAAGPGKTLMLIEDHMLSCARFNVDEAPEVHTLLLRRTHPKLTATVITRFREKIPRELYRDFNSTTGVVTWPNGATTQFGSMQYEHDVWGYQGQWYKIGYDELTEFTFGQWQNISAWNRCPVSKRCTKDGATNPIGVGAPWVEDVFVNGRACTEMDDRQKAMFDPNDYGYFPATYRDNPIYANDTEYIKSLDSYQEAISLALKEGIWGVAGGYFDGAWDEAANVYEPETVELKPWWKRWLGGDWGFGHNSVIHWFCMDDAGVVRIYRELVTNRKTGEELAEMIAEKSAYIDHEGRKKYEAYEFFSFSHDAFGEKQDTNPIALRMGVVLSGYGMVQPERSTKDKMGREQQLYDCLRGRITTGHVVNPETQTQEPIQVARLQISKACPNLIRTIPKAPRDEDNREEIAEFLGDDALQSSGYGLYRMFGKPNRLPIAVRVAARIDPIEDMSLKMLHRAKVIEQEKRKTDIQPLRRNSWHTRRWVKQA